MLTESLTLLLKMTAVTNSLTAALGGDPGRLGLVDVTLVKVRFGGLEFVGVVLPLGFWTPVHAVSPMHRPIKMTESFMLISFDNVSTHQRHD